MRKLFTERRDGTKPRVAESLTDAAKLELLLLIHEKYEKEWFGFKYNWKCADGLSDHAGTSDAKLRAALEGYGLPTPSDWMGFATEDLPPDDKVFDLIEFSWEVIAESKIETWHDYLRHHHYDYNQKSGRDLFTSEVNRVFERHGIAFELRDGEVTRVAPAILHEVLAQTVFNSGDSALDALLETSRNKFLNRNDTVRRESLEQLWDAWERVKTLDDPRKDRGIRSLLDQASPEPTFRARLDSEGTALTKIGNDFMIRHHESDKVPITDSAHVDYLFHRMFAMIRLLLEKRGP